MQLYPDLEDYLGNNIKKSAITSVISPVSYYGDDMRDKLGLQNTKPSLLGGNKSSNM